MDIFCIWKAFISLKTNPHYKEAGYFYHVVPSKKLVFISSTSEDEQLVQPWSGLAWIRTGNLWIGIPAT